MTKKTEPAQNEQALKTVTLTLTMPMADHLGKLLNTARYSGTVPELSQILAMHDALVLAFNEAVTK